MTAQKPDSEPVQNAPKLGPPADFRAALIDALPSLRRFSMTLSRDRSNSDDLTQATCERALAKWHQFQPDTQLQSWLFSIMHSIWKNELRRSHNQQRAFGKLKHENNQTDGEREVFGKIELSEVLSALKGVSIDQAAAITLVSLDGLSYRQAADILEIPQGTLESRIARGRIALGKLLEGKSLDNNQKQDVRQNALERKSRRLT